jgi:hypothetical protein
VLPSVLLGPHPQCPLSHTQTNDALRPTCYSSDAYVYSGASMPMSARGGRGGGRIRTRRRTLRSTAGWVQPVCRANGSPRYVRPSLCRALSCAVVVDDGVWGRGRTWRPSSTPWRRRRSAGRRSRPRPSCMPPTLRSGADASGFSVYMCVC